MGKKEEAAWWRGVEKFFKKERAIWDSAERTAPNFVDKGFAMYERDYAEAAAKEAGKVADELEE